MPGLAGFVEGIDLQPAEVLTEAGRPDDRGDAGRRQIQLADRVGQAVRVREARARLRAPPAARCRFARHRRRRASSMPR